MTDKKAGFDSVDDYIATFPDDVQRTLEQIRATIREAAPEAVEKINYQIPTFAQNGNLVQYAAYEKHIGFYPAPSGIAAFQDELTGYESAKGSVKFPIGEPMPLDLIRQITAFRVQENVEKAKQKAARKNR